MLITNVYTLLLHWMCCELCLAIKVPVVWNYESDSEVNTNNEDFSIDQFQPPNIRPVNNHVHSKPIPVEYFQYTAKKPQFAVDVDAYHGVQSPENHYRAYPIRPYTELQKPDLGKHQIFNNKNNFYEPFQKYTEQEELTKHTAPHESSYEVFHPYKAEEPGLKEIYKDPVLLKIRNDLKNTKDRLQNYEKEAGKADISKEEYLESPETTDRKKLPQKNIPSQFEVHRPHRRPVYYKVPVNYNPRYNYLNQRFRHPLNQNYIKVRPMHYRPLQNHLQSLRQHHALKYDDEQNEYPHVTPVENFAEPPEGYDIYEKGKANYKRLRDNVDESINAQVRENRPIYTEKLELQNDEKSNEDENDKEFIPVKNYAQVRKTETSRFLPRNAAFEEATSLDEIRNAPRLREAVKSTRAQTVYSEEGYEDSAYDHAGEQKHASDHEGHGGYLVEKELSGGKYKIPSVSAAYEDARGSAEGDKVLHGEKWKNNDKDTNEENESEDYTDDEHEKILASDIYQDIKKSNDNDADNERDKRQGKDSDHNDNEDDEVEDYVNNDDNSSLNDDSSKDVNLKYDENKRDKREKNEETELSGEHDLNKREASFKVPEINLNDTFLTEKELLQQAKEKIIDNSNQYLKEKYPYYFKNLNTINKLSPLRYAENLKFIPNKTKGGTEFYDSRNKLLECPEVEDIDPIPDKIKNNTTDTNEKDANVRKRRQADFDQVEEQPRLKSLGDKIDCFKAKYFGENPLDSPFFKEEYILTPEPIELPELPSYKLKTKSDLTEQSSKFNNVISLSDKLKEENKKSISSLFEKLNTDIFPTSGNISETSETKINLVPVFPNIIGSTLNKIDSLFNNKSSEQVPTLRRKRRSPNFLYEPYKVIRDHQVQESKKIITTNNISPLIRQLQSTTKSNQTQNIGNYKVIGREDRSKNTEENEQHSSEKSPTFVNVSFDSRRGEPRYEIEPTNHKSLYSPISNKRSMTVEDYANRVKPESLKNNSSIEKIVDVPESDQNIEFEITTKRPYFDVSKFLPPLHSPVQNIRRVVRTSTPSSKSGVKRIENAVLHNKKRRQSSVEESEELLYENEEPQEKTTITPRKRRFRVTTTTPANIPEDEHVDENSEENHESSKLKLVTRFIDDRSKNNKKPKENIEKKTEQSLNNDKPNTQIPKYKEKSKKTSKSTLVTDSKSYGDGGDDMRVDEIDAMIGVQQDMAEYKPQYEKEITNNKQIKLQPTEPNAESEEADDSVEEDNGSNEDENSGSDEEYEDSSEDDDDDEEEEVEVDESEEEINDDNEKEEQISTTTTPKINEHLTSAVEGQHSKLQPLIVKKKIEIHKELPFNKSSPHVTQYKEDIKEEEIIKEYPQSQNKQETLNLYKDKNLATEVNKLGDVEVFKANLDIVAGPKHGGNYRSARITDVNKNNNSPKHGGHLREDAEPSQSKDIEDIKSDDSTPQRKRQRNNRNYAQSRKNEELFDLRNSEVKDTPLHGGNYRAYKDISTDRSKSEKNNKESSIKIHRVKNDESRQNNKGDYKSSRKNEELIALRDSDIKDTPLHGGNYRSYKDISTDRSQLGKNRNDNSKDENSREHYDRQKKNINRKSTFVNSHSGDSNTAYVRTNVNKNARKNYDENDDSGETNSDKKKSSLIRGNSENPIKYSERQTEIDSSEEEEREIEKPSRRKHSTQYQKRGKKLNNGNNENNAENIEYFIPPKFMNTGKKENVTYNSYRNTPDDYEENDENKNSTHDSEADNIKKFIPSKFLNTAKFSESDKNSADNANNENTHEDSSQEDNLKAKSERSRDSRNDPAVVLNTFAQAVPILTTTPSYILDPSKRKYYYVDD